MISRSLFALFIAALSLVASTGCNRLLGSTQATQALLRNVSANTRWVTINGRTTISNFNDEGGAHVPLTGVNVTAMIDGLRVDAVSDSKGFWSFVNVPVRMTGSNGAPVNPDDNVNIYFDADGFVTQVKLIKLYSMMSAAEESPASNYQIDVGPVAMVPQLLMFQSNVVRVWNNSLHFVGGSKCERWIDQQRRRKRVFVERHPAHHFKFQLSGGCCSRRHFFSGSEKSGGRDFALLRPVE